MLIMAMPLSLQAHADSGTELIAMWDADDENSLDLGEFNKAAAAEFDKLNLGHDGTSDMKELPHRLRFVGSGIARKSL